MAGGSKIAKLFVELGFKDEDFKRGIKGAASDLDKFGSKLKSFGKLVDKAVVRGFQAATGAAIAFGTSVVITGARFEQSMATVRAISGATGEDFDALEKKARDLGATTTFSATQAADAMQQLARAGLETNEIIGASGPALAFAGAMGADMSQATTMLASTMSQFGLGASESTRIVDTFTAAINSSLLDITKLQEAMKYAGTAGAAFGMSVEDTTAAVGMFANIGLEGSQAGMNFRMAMIAAGKSTEKKERIMRKLKMTMADINPAMNTFEEILQKVHAAGMSSTEAVEIFGSRAGSNVFKLSQDVANSSDSWTKLNDAIGDSAGTTEDTYETMTNTVQGQFTILKSTIQETQLALFSGMQEGMTDLIQAWIEVFQLVGMVLSDANSGITQDWNQTMHGMADSVRDNKAAIAGDIIEMIEMFGNLIFSIQKVIKWAKNLAKILAVMFVAKWGYVLAEVIMMVVIPSFTAATVAAAKLSAAINTMTAGIPLLVGGIAAGVTALFAWGGGMSEAEKAAARMQKQMELLAAADKRYRDGLIAGVTENADAHGDWLHLLETELNTHGNVANAITREIDTLRDANAEALADMIASGDAFQMTLESGEEVTMSTGLLVRLAGDEILDANGHYQAALDAHKATFEQEKSDGEARLAWLEEEIAEQRRIKRAGTTTTKSKGSRLQGTWVPETTTMTMAATTASNKLTLLVSEFNTLGETLRRSSTEFDGFTNAVKRSEEQIEREKQALENLKKEQEAQTRRQNWKNLVREREAAADRTIKLFDQMLDAANKAAGEEERVAADVHRRKLEDIEATFDEEARLWRRNAEKVAEIEARKQETLLNANRAFWGEYVTTANEAAEEITTATTEGDQNEIQQLQKKHEAALQELERGEARMLQVTVEGSQERLNAVAAFAASRSALESAQGSELAALRSKLNREALQKIMEESIELQHQQISEWERLKNEEAEAIAQAVEDGLDIESAIRDQYHQKRVALRKDVDREVLRLLDEQAANVKDLEDERNALLLRMTNHTEAERAAVTKHYEGLIRDELRGTSDEAEKGSRALLDFIRSMSAQALADVKSGFMGLAAAVRDVGAAALAAGAAGVSSLSRWSGLTAKLTAASEDLSGWWAGIKQKAGDSSAGQWLKGAGKDVERFVDDARFVIGTGMEWVADTKVGKAFGNAFAFAGEQAQHLGKIASGVGKFFAAGAGVAVAALGGLVKGVGVVKDAVGGISAAFSKVMDTVAMLTGFTFSLADAVGAVNDQMAERADLEAQLAEGGLTGDEIADINAQLDELPATAADAGAAFVQDLISGSVMMAQNFAESAPVILQELANGIPGLISAIAEALPAIAQGIAAAIPAIIQAISDALPNLLAALSSSMGTIVGAIVEAIPMVITALGEALPMIIGMISSAMVQIIEAIPDIVGAIIAALPEIITALASMAGDLISALVGMIPDLIQGIVDSLPEIITALVEAVLLLIEVVLAEWPTLIAAVIDAIPVVLDAVLAALPDVILAVVAALPGLVQSVVDNLPKVLTALVKMIPDLVVAIVEHLPEIIQALVVELVPALIVAAVDMAVQFVKGLLQFFKDVMTEIWGFIKHPFNEDKRPVTQTFGDTPGVQLAGAGGALVGFKAGDFFAAAQKPEDLLAQAARAFEQTRGAIAPTNTGGGNMLEGLGSALMAAAMSMQTLASTGGMGGAGDLRVTVTAEGRTLDDVLYIGNQRGHTPQLTREIRRTAGAHIGFDRGRYSPSS